MNNRNKQSADEGSLIEGRGLNGKAGGAGGRDADLPPLRESDSGEDAGWQSSWNAGLEQLDRWAEQSADAPGEEWFGRIVERGKKEKRRKLVRDLALFWSVSIVVLAIYLAAVYGRPILFVSIQAAVLLAVPVVAAVAKHKRKRVEQR